MVAKKKSSPREENFMRSKYMRVAAHRGFSEKYPENTMEAFRAAVDAGADEIETDVRVSADGELVLMHDETVDRTTDGTGKVCEMTLSELKKLDAGVKKGAEFAGTKIPTLRELFELVKDHPTLTLDIELKEYPTEGREALAFEVCDRALAMIDEYGFTERCVVNSWNGKLNEYVREKYGNKYRQHVYYPETLLGECTVDPYSYAYCACLFTNNPEAYDYMRERGVQPWVGAGVNNEEKLDIAIANGACAITCNNVDEILALLRKKGLHK
jgi:glycerophosphoryl diester phosphodiesterase